MQETHDFTCSKGWGYIQDTHDMIMGTAMAGLLQIYVVSIDVYGFNVSRQ
jgi:hypothetical protein